MSIQLFLLTATSPGLMAIGHAVIYRLARRYGAAPQKVAAISALLSAFCLSTIAFSVEGANSAAFTLVTTCLLAHVYFHLFNMSETARRIHILVEIKKGRSDRVKMQSYSARQIADIRIERLLNLESIQKRGERYFTSGGSLTQIALVMKAYERLLFPYRFKPKSEKAEQPLRRVSGR